MGKVYDICARRKRKLSNNGEGLDDEYSEPRAKRFGSRRRSEFRNLYITFDYNSDFDSTTTAQFH